MAEHESLVLYGEDQSSSFYLCALPPQWRPFMAFNKKVPGHLVGCPSLASTYITSTVMPMGWLLSVAAMQHVGRRLALCPPPLGAGLALPDLRGDRPIINSY
eukprot:5536400-Amphidinium_carterae.1